MFLRSGLDPWKSDRYRPAIFTRFIVMFMFIAIFIDWVGAAEFPA